ncbi:unnamed protein product, partial [Notodromas monacha]
EVGGPSVTLNVLGHQWYWEYSLANIEGEREPKVGVARLLDVDNKVVLPSNVLTRVLVRAGDVIHSWALPELGVKVDAVPGRLNQVGVCPG